MTEYEPATMVGIFEEQGQAAKAIQALKRSGFADDQIGVASREWSKHLQGVRVDEQHAAEHGAVTGAVVGGGLGAALGLAGAILVPAAIPFIAGHALLTALGGGLAGASGGVFAGTFAALGHSEKEARKHARHVEEGKTAVLVYAPGREREAQSILVANGAYDESMSTDP